MNKLIYALIGTAIGGVVGFFIGKATSKAKYEKELKAKTESIKSTYDDLLNKVRKDSEEKLENAKKEIESLPENDGGGKVNVLKEAKTEDDDEDYGDFEDDDWEGELRDARRQFLREMQADLELRGEPYNISEEVYNEPFPGFGKGSIMIDESNDKAYDQDGEEVEDWHVVVGDLDYGNLDEDRKDEYGRIYVRCPRVAMDYEVTWSRIELAH